MLQKNKQIGFTLIEIGIVLFVIGILVVLFLPTFTQDIKTDAKVREVIKTAEVTINAITSIRTECNIALNNVVLTTATGLLNTGITFSKVLSEGNNATSVITNIKPAFRYCFQNANLTANNNIILNSAGYYTITSLDTGLNVGKQRIINLGGTINYNFKNYAGACFRDYNKSDILPKVAQKLYPSVVLPMFSGYSTFEFNAGKVFNWTDDTGATPFYQICIYDYTQGSI